MRATRHCEKDILSNLVKAYNFKVLNLEVTFKFYSNVVKLKDRIKKFFNMTHPKECVHQK